MQRVKKLLSKEKQMDFKKNNVADSTKEESKEKKKCTALIISQRA